MNPELQLQTDLLLKALKHLETTLDQDAFIVIVFFGTLLVALCMINLFRRK